MRRATGSTRPNPAHPGSDSTAKGNGSRTRPWHARPAHSQRSRSRSTAPGLPRQGSPTSVSSSTAVDAVLGAAKLPNSALRNLGTPPGCSVTVARAAASPRGVEGRTEAGAARHGTATVVFPPSPRTREPRPQPQRQPSQPLRARASASVHPSRCVDVDLSPAPHYDTDMPIGRSGRVRTERPDPIRPSPRRRDVKGNTHPRHGTAAPASAPRAGRARK